MDHADGPGVPEHAQNRTKGLDSLCGDTCDARTRVNTPQVYGHFAAKLNNLENYRTETEFEDALIVKSFLFRFFNAYTSLFYIAFVKGIDVEVPDRFGCVAPVTPLTPPPSSPC